MRTHRLLQNKRSNCITLLKLLAPHPISFTVSHLEQLEKISVILMHTSTMLLDVYHFILHRVEILDVVLRYTYKRLPSSLETTVSRSYVTPVGTEWHQH